MVGRTGKGALISRSRATDGCEPCQDRDIAALSNFVPCDLRSLWRSYLSGYRFGGCFQKGMCSISNIRADGFEKLPSVFFASK